MAYIVFDYKCAPCKVEFKNCMVGRDEMDDQRCSKCQALLTRLPAGTKTTFAFADKSGIKG
jgi:hypothetical protein